MKITDVRTRVVEWRGRTVPPQPHFCTNPMDLLDLPLDSMAGFRFYGWLIVEVFTDTGQVGIGNSALSPRITKQIIDLYLKPLLIGKDPSTWVLWRLMYRQTMAGRKGVGMVAISAVDLAIWDILGKARDSPIQTLGWQNQTESRLCQPPLQSESLRTWPEHKRRLSRDEDAFRLGAGGRRRWNQRNIELVRTLRFWAMKLT